MTLSEFKAWFEGFSEGIDTAPTEAQFAKIKAKVALIDGAPITYPIFVERYWGRAWPAYPVWIGDPIVSSGGTYATYGAVGVSVVSLANAGYASMSPTTKGDSQTSTWDSHAAMNALGRVEASAAA